MLEITFARVECELVCSVCSLCVTLLGFRVCHRDSGGSSCVRQSGGSCVSLSWSFLVTGHALGSYTGQSVRDTTRKLVPSKMIRSRGGSLYPRAPGSPRATGPAKVSATFSSRHLAIRQVQLVGRWRPVGNTLGLSTYRWLQDSRQWTRAFSALPQSGGSLLVCFQWRAVWSLVGRWKIDYNEGTETT